MTEAERLAERLEEKAHNHTQDDIAEWSYMAEAATLLRAQSARIAALEDALRAATKTANLLYANAVGCATNHYGEDIHQHGLPGWLADCAKDIEAAAEALGKGSE